MRIYIKAVRVNVRTETQTLARTLLFDAGLNVVRGNNSAGKSQVLQAIVWALGVEAIFGPPRLKASQLGSAFSDEVILRDDTVAPVVESYCAVEIENSDGRVLTVQRFVKHDSIGRDLIRVWDVAGLSSASSVLGAPTDYFVNRKGSAKGEFGFARLLAEFLGWNLPNVPRYTGGEPVLLYVELLFPFFYADQRDWSEPGPRRVSHLMIREPSRRAAEFLLGLAGPRAQAEKDRLTSRMSRLKGLWTENVTAVLVEAGAIGARIVGVPQLPAGMRDSSVVPSDLSGVGLRIYQGGEWKKYSEVVSDIRNELSALKDDEQPSAESPVALKDEPQVALQDELHEEEDRLASTLAAASVIDANLSLEEAQLAALDRRIAAFEEESARHDDLRTLQRLGSANASSHLADHDCPTCRQSLASVEAADLGPILDIDASAKIVKAQLSTLKSMRTQSIEAVQQAGNVFRALQSEADTLRSGIRALRSDLESPAGYPSESNITARITGEFRLQQLGRIQTDVDTRIETLREIATEAAQVRADLQALPDNLKDDDAEIVDRVVSSMQEQLEAFGFRSYSAQKVGIDEETLRPVRHGFDLESDVSASDVVRVKIAYLNAVREVGTSINSPHPGLLLLDEPRQHELDEENFRSTLKRLSTSTVEHGQVIVTSAASADSLSSQLGTATARVVDLGEERLLVPDTALSPIDL